MSTQTSTHPFDLLLEYERRNLGRGDGAEIDDDADVVIAGRLAFRIGSWSLMFAMNEVAEIIPVPRISRVPGVKSWLLGIANLRGTVISIIDLHRFLSQTATAVTSSSRIIVVTKDEWLYGLLVDEVIGMRHFGAEGSTAELNQIDADVHPYLVEVFRAEDRIWAALSVGRLLSDPRFMGAAS